MIQTFKTTLAKKELITEHIYLLEFKLVDPPQLDFITGQYMMLVCPQPDGQNLTRLYSIASAADKKDTFQLVVEIIPNGVGSTYVLSMKPGDEVQFRGPAGLFKLRDNNQRIFLATGTGIAPIRSMLLELIRGDARTEHTTFLFWGVKHYKDIYFLDELKLFTQEHPSFEFFVCLSREENFNVIPEENKKYFFSGRVNAGLEHRLGKDISGQPIAIPTEFDYYVCGGRTVVESLRLYLGEQGVPAQKVVFEKF